MKRWQKVKTKDGVEGRVIENKPDGFKLIKPRDGGKPLSKFRATLTLLNDKWEPEDD